MDARTFGLALALGSVLGWTTVLAAPNGRHAKRTRRPVAPPPAAIDDDVVIEDAATPDAKQVALESRDTGADADADIIDRAPRKDTAIARTARAPADHGWQVAIGPYIWASSVEANVQLGAATAGVDIGFIPLVQHTRYGIEALAEVRHGRFAISADVMYGVTAVTGSTDVAGLMVTLDGSASSLLIDGAVSYDVVGDQDAVFSLAARGGLRYQRTVVDGAVSIAGASVSSPEAVDDAADGIVGARGVVRPVPWLALSGMFDIGVIGASDRTWSATGDASVRVSSHVLVSAGWRTLTLERARVSLSLQGPRAAVQLVF
jgi:hypothetical protein